MTFKYKNVYINDTATVTGKYESDGPLSKYFDKTYDDILCGCNGILKRLGYLPK